MKNNTSNQDFIKITGELGAGLGLNRSIGQIYGLLYMSDAPLSLDTISTTLKMSKGSVSLNIRELEKWEAVKKIWVNGTRKDFYEADIDFVNIIYKRMKLRIEKIFIELSENLNKTVSKNYDKNVAKKINQIKMVSDILRNLMKNLPDEISIKKLIKVIK